MGARGGPRRGAGRRVGQSRGHRRPRGPGGTQAASGRRHPLGRDRRGSDLERGRAGGGRQCRRGAPG